MSVLAAGFWFLSLAEGLVSPALSRLRIWKSGLFDPMSDTIDLSLVSRHPYRELLKLSGPLILSMSGLTLMQLIDSLMLSWYSPEALGASGAAGIANYGLMCLFLGAGGYASTLVAHYMGAGDLRKVGASVWQSIYFSLASGFVVFFCAYAAKPLFAAVDHTQGIQEMEVTFFKISCWGGWASLFAGSLSTFFSGRGDTRTLMIAQITGFVMNLVLDYLLIFGNFGFQRMGVAGAAIATVSAQALIATILGVLFLGKSTYRKVYQTWDLRRFDLPLSFRLIKFGLPTGFRMTIEMLSWIIFVFFVGRIGSDELASSTIAWRINGLAFFPIIGLAQACGILVGNAQGKKLPGLTLQLCNRAMVVAELWMFLWIAVFMLFPHQLYGIFKTGDFVSGGSFGRIADLGVVLLRFVAIYCILDSCNIVYLTVLQCAGDTRWTFIATLIVYGIFIAGLWAADFFHAGLYQEWLIATVFIMILALVWVARFYQGAWKEIRVIREDDQLA
jgi:MATE family multidrug resistance protein